MNENKKHNHNETFHEICDYLGGDLESDACQSIKEHLENCTDCDEYIESIKNTVKMFRENDECLETPGPCKDKILNNIHDALKNRAK